MGQIQTPPSAQTLILTALDRLVASNADGGMSPAAAHVVLLGEHAGENLGALSYIYAIGAETLGGGMINAANNGSVAYGGLVLPALVNTLDFFPQGPDGPFLAMGYNIAPRMVSRFQQTLALGANLFRNYPPGGLELFGDVFIGNGIQEFNRVLNSNGGSGSFNVMIGHNVARCSNAINTDGGGTVFNGNVFIGAEVAELGGANLNTPGSVCQNNVFIGRQVARQVSNNQNTNAQANVFIGNQAGTTFTRGSENVAIGSGCGVGSVALADIGQVVLLGANIVHSPVAAASGNIIVGYGGVMSGMGSGNVFIGPQVNGDNAINAGSFHFLMASNVGGVIRNLLYGRFSGASPGPGGLIVGNSAPASQDVPGYNILKIIDGTWTGVAPVGGGFFYSAAGTLHWVDTGGNDSTLAGPGGESSPAALPLGQTDDWAGGFGSDKIINVTANILGSQLSGMLGGFGGRQVTLFVSGGQLDLLNEDAGSTPANQFLGPSGAGVSISDGGSVTLVYSATAARWRPLSQN